jgi:hypothetical protein
MRSTLIVDKPPFFRSVQLGNWLHVFDYETQQGKWEWTGARLTPEQEKHREIFSQAGTRRWEDKQS